MKSINRQTILDSIQKHGTTVEAVEKSMLELRKESGFFDKVVGALPNLGQQGLKLTGLMSILAGAGIGLGGIYPGYKMIQDSQDKVDQKQQEIARYQQAVKQLEQNMQNPTVV